MESKKLNFGCGKKILEGFTNVDIQNAPGIDKSFDFEKFPYPFKDNTFEYVLADNVFEHLVNLDKVMEELWRICKPGAIIHICVPYWNHSMAYNDYDHKHYFNERAIEILCNKKLNCQHYVKDLFEIDELNYIPGKTKKRIPLKILHFLDKFLRGMFIELEAKVKVIKK